MHGKMGALGGVIWSIDLAYDTPDSDEWFDG